jgi:hypothetical protein
MVVPHGQDVPVYEADLEEIKRAKKKQNKNHTPDQKAAFWGGLQYYALERGFRMGWASHKYREKYGVWPNAYRDVPPTPPTPDLINWIKSRNIAWSKRQQN